MQYLTFSIQNEDYAVAADRVDEILPMIWIKRIPSAPSFLEGIINLRGQLIPVMDMNKRLGISRSSSYKQGTRLIVTRLTNLSLALIIDKVNDICEIEEHRESVLNRKETPFVDGILLKENQLIQVLVPEYILTEDEENKLAKAVNHAQSE